MSRSVMDVVQLSGSSSREISIKKTKSPAKIPYVFLIQNAPKEIKVAENRTPKNRKLNSE